MNKKRASIFIVTLLLFSFVLTGCGADTIGFVNHLDEIQKVATNKSTQTESRISISDIRFPMEEIPTYEKERVQAVIDFLDQYYISITQTANPNKDISSISFNLIQKLDRKFKKEHVLTLNYKDGAFAISISPKLAELSPEVFAMVNPFADKLIPLSVFEDFLGEQALILSSLSNRENLLEMNEKSMTYLKEIGKIYRSMATRFITKDSAYGGSYLFQMNAPEFAEFLNEFISITVENTDSIIKATSNFFESLTEEEFNMLYGQLFPDGKTEMIALLKEAMEMSIPEDTLDIWNASYDSEIKPLIINTMEGSSVSMRLWKDNEKYYTNLYSVLKISIPGEPSINLGGTMLIKEELQVISDDFNIEMPTNVISDSLIKSILPAPIKIGESTENTEIFVE